VAYVINPANPVIAGASAVDGEILDVAVEPVEPQPGQPASFYVFAAGGERGLQVMSAVKSSLPAEVGIYESPGTAPIGEVIRAGFGLLTGESQGVSGKAIRSAIVVAFDFLVLGALGLLFWLAFFAQFVLPLKSLSERLQAANRLFHYLMGSHGPAIRIENGKIKERPGESQKSGPGVILLDSASAAMLRSKTAFTRPIGPGVFFTSPREFVHREAIDLHRQVRPRPPLGPLGDENPFSSHEEGETEEEYQRRQARRMQTSAWTRDGVEVVPKILSVFKLRGEKGQGYTHFGYDAEAIRLGITREGVVPEELSHVRWYELPAYLAVDLWREYLGKFTLNELFDADTGEKKGVIEVGEAGLATTWARRGETGLEIIKRLVRARLTAPKVEELDAVGRLTRVLQTSREYRILSETGIHVFAASINNLQFPPAIENQLVQQWLSTWLQRAQRERDYVERRRGYAIHQGKEIALKEYAAQVKHLMEENLLDAQGRCIYDRRVTPALDEMLRLLLEGTQDLIIRDTQLHRFLENEENAVAEMIARVRGQGA
ncbi:MAG TPA: hypothetical protein VIK64_07880, partial [Anaerolineales bacterium]